MENRTPYNDIYVIVNPSSTLGFRAGTSVPGVGFGANVIGGIVIVSFRFLFNK
jgi:hypothetical protein